MDMNIEQPVLQGGRVKLRPLQASDAGLMTLYASDKRVARNLSRVPHPYPPGCAEAYINSIVTKSTTEITWAIDLANGEHSEMIGVVSLKPTGTRRAVIGYWVAPALWGAGYASEAATLVVKHARTMALEALEAHVIQPNDASAKILMRIGFGYVGDSEQHSIYHGRMMATWDYQLML